MVTPLIVGDAGDSHVTDVVAALNDNGSTPILIDAPKLQASSYLLELDSLTIEDRSVDLATARGWLRRYAPDAWGQGEVTGSLKAVKRHAFLRLTGSISRLAQQWLTPLDALLAAEDRLHQLAVAQQLGIRIPRTLVTTDPARAHEDLGRSFVVKPLATGWYRRDDGEARAVFAQILDASVTASLDFSSAPFVLQETIAADRHLRVVTVRDKCWVAALDADGRPLDWRADASAHLAWEVSSDTSVAKPALVLARRLRAGFTSQDWVVSQGEHFFLDLNPAGQWLFLPDEVSDQVTRGIAEYLSGQEPLSGML